MLELLEDKLSVQGLQKLEGAIHIKLGSAQFILSSQHQVPSLPFLSFVLFCILLSLEKSSYSNTVALKDFLAG